MTGSRLSNSPTPAVARRRNARVRSVPRKYEVAVSRVLGIWVLCCPAKHRTDFKKAESRVPAGKNRFGRRKEVVHGVECCRVDRDGATSAGGPDRVCRMPVAAG